MGYKPRTSGGGGGGTPGLPMWTFAAADNSDPSSGKFTTDSVDSNNTTMIILSTVPKGDVLASGMDVVLGNIPVGATMLLVDSSGQQYNFQIVSVTPGGPPNFVAFTFTNHGNSKNWSGDYQVTFWPNTSITTIIPTLAQVLATSSITPINDGSNFGTLVGVTTQSGIITAESTVTPVADGTTTPVTSVTTQTGIVTALS